MSHWMSCGILKSIWALCAMTCGLRISPSTSTERSCCDACQDTLAVKHSSTVDHLILHRVKTHAVWGFSLSPAKAGSTKGYAYETVNCSVQENLCYDSVDRRMKNIACLW
ncbi:hypothetical protein BJV78DRAFT_1251696 [Lactifluus subvellereus]|nr:hypothetical protein BJV78DRAFT_1251696 [Lactifluus subvellereus]